MRLRPAIGGEQTTKNEPETTAEILPSIGTSLLFKIALAFATIASEAV